MIVMIMTGILAPSVRAVERKSPVQNALSLWLEGKPDHALREVDAKVRVPASSPGRGDVENAALRNLGARIHYDRYHRMRADRLRSAVDELEAAQAFAAAAVWESPYELEYWRDFIRIGAFDLKSGETRIEPFIDRFNASVFSFRVEGSTRFLTNHPELRQIAHAVSWEQRSNIIVAEEVLQSWLEGRESSASCAASVVLADLNVEMDRFATAQALLEQRARTCGRMADICAAKLARMKARLPEQPANSSQQHPASLVGRSDGLALNERIDVESQFLNDDDDTLDIADRLLRDPSRMDDWRRLWEVAGTDHDLQRIYDQVLAVVDKRPGAASVPEIAQAAAYRQVERGRFVRARRDLQKLLVRSNGNADAELLVGSVLLDSDEALPRPDDADKRLEEAERADPHIAACLDTRELNRCLRRRHGCAPPAIVCSNGDEFIFRVWKSGLARRPHALAGTNQFTDRVRNEVGLTQKMIRDTESRLLADMQSREEGFQRRIAAIEQRIEVVVEQRMASLEQQVRRVARDQDDFERRMAIETATLRREVQTEMERSAAASARAEYAAHASRHAALEVARLWTQHAADIAALRVMGADLQRLIGEDRKRYEAILAQLAIAVEELQRPELSRHLKILRNARNEPWEKSVNSLAYLLDEITTAAILPGKKLLLLIPAIKAASDLYLDWRQRARKRAAVRDAPWR